MANCEICGKSDEVTVLYHGIHEGSVKRVCPVCCSMENIIAIRKPTPAQLAEAEKRKSVREIMEKMSSPQQSIMRKDSMIAHKNLSKLHFPGMKQEHIDLVENYDWVLKQARRHKKLSSSQVSEQSGVEKNKIESLEAGQLFTGFEKDIAKLEQFYNVKVLKLHALPGHLRTQDMRKRTEQEVLGYVKAKMQNRPVPVEIDDRPVEYGKIDVDEILRQREASKEEHRQSVEQDFAEDKVDFSRKDNLKNITIQDLAELKKKREANKK